MKNTIASATITSLPLGKNAGHYPACIDFMWHTKLDSSPAYVLNRLTGKYIIIQAQQSLITEF